MKQTLRSRSVGSASWRNRDLLRVGGAQAVTFLAGEVVVVSMLLQAYSAGWGAPGAAAVLVAAALPLALGTFVAGPLVDRMSSRRLSVAAASWQAGVCAAGAVALVLGAHQAWLLLVLLMLQAGQAVAGPTWSALLPSVVEREALPAAVGRVSALVMLVGMLGPALAGGVMATGGAAAALAVSAAGLTVVALLATRVRVVRAGTAAAGAPAPRMLDGLRFVRTDPVLSVLVAGFVTFVLVVELVGVVLVLLVRGDLGAGELSYGVLGSVMAVGLVAGSVLAGRLPAGHAMVRAAVVGMLGMSGALLLTGAAQQVVALGAALLVLGGFNGVANVAAQTTSALRVPLEQRGRVLAAVSGVLRTASVLGLLVGGVIGTVVEPRTVVLGAGCAGLLVAAWTAFRLWPPGVDEGSAVAPASAGQGARDRPHDAMR